MRAYFVFTLFTYDYEDIKSENGTYTQTQR